MTPLYGNDITQWPSAATKLAPGMTLYQVFLSGGNPLDPTTWLQQWPTKSAQGMFLNWNTQPGATYRVSIPPRSSE